MRSMPEKKIEKLKRDIAACEQQIEIAELRIKSLRKIINIKLKSIAEIKVNAIFKETRNVKENMAQY